MLDGEAVMKALSRALAGGLAYGAAMLLLGQDALTVRPRSASSEYRSQAATRETELGAELLPRSEASRFFTPLEDKYYVVEVGIYPVGGETVDLKRGQFRLRADGKILKTQNPHAIATFLVQTAPPEPGMETTSYGGESVGVRMETGRPTEVFRQQRAGVGISSGHYWTSEDRETMYRELSSLELPEEETTKPVAGYLYFSIKNKGPVENMELIYRHRGENVILHLD